MKIIKQLIIATLITFTASSVFANKISVKFNQSMLQEIFKWEFLTVEDGMIFLLGPESDHKLEIHVNTTTKGKVSDTVTVNCNASSYRIHAGSSLTCYGNFNDMSTMYIAAEDLKNGSNGTYEFKPITN